MSAPAPFADGSGGFSPQLAVANNRIITLQEDVERVKEESSYQLESRKVKEEPPFTDVVHRDLTCMCNDCKGIDAGGEKRLGGRRTSAGRDAQAAQRGNSASTGEYQGLNAGLGTFTTFSLVRKPLYLTCRTWRRSWRCRSG